MVLPPKLRGYAAERLLGRGATGDVWQARLLATGARVALKRIPVTGPEQLARAEAEAALLAALEHVNLVRLHAVVPIEDAMVLILDLAEGGSLAGLLAARGRLAPGEVITAVAPVAAALAYLHEEGIVHADVSAANILFTARGEPLLSDVGVARLTGDDRDAEATPAYVDPLVAAGCVPGPQSDVFMLGGVALHALTGAPPWPDADPELALARAAAGVLDDIAARLADAHVDAAMAQVVCRALHADPQRRGSAADLALDLRHSGAPIAVELAAGRAAAISIARAWTGPRHAVGRPSALAAATPEPAACVDDTAPPTRMVGPRPRPVVPHPASRRRPPRAMLLAGAGVLVAAAALLAWWPGGGASRHVPHPVAKAQAQVETSRPGRVPAGGASPAGRVRAAPTDWLAELRRLDALRGLAFARRDPALLARVYPPGPLLRSDAALLARVVPTGCGLSGLRSRYAGARVQAGAGRAVVTASATLSASRLMCGQRVRGVAASAGPTTLRFVLARTGGGVRIVAEQLI